MKNFNKLLYGFKRQLLKIKIRIILKKSNLMIMLIENLQFIKLK